MDRVTWIYSIENNKAVITDIGPNNIREPSNRNLTIPSVINGHTVSSIVGEAITNDNMTGVYVLNILHSSYFKSINLPNGIKSIEDFAFSECRGLTYMSMLGSGKPILDIRLTICKIVYPTLSPPLIEKHCPKLSIQPLRSLGIWAIKIPLKP